MRDSAEKCMFTQNDAPAPLRVCLILTKEAALDIISRKINGAKRDLAGFSSSNDNFDHLIPHERSTVANVRSKLGQDR